MKRLEAEALLTLTVADGIYEDSGRNLSYETSVRFAEKAVEKVLRESWMIHDRKVHRIAEVVINSSLTSTIHALVEDDSR